MQPGFSQLAEIANTEISNMFVMLFIALGLYAILDLLLSLLFKRKQKNK